MSAATRWIGVSVYRASTTSRTTATSLRVASLSTQSNSSNNNTNNNNNNTSALDHERRYVRERKVYQEQVSILRKRYAAEIAAQRAREVARRAADRAVQTTQRQERQRQKDARSVTHAQREARRRAARAVEFAHELAATQVRRAARQARYRRARQLCVDDLEQEAAVWMTTKEEVDAALSGRDNAQRLWATPCLIGAAPPDAEFWRYEAHTLPRLKTVPTAKEMVLEKLEESLVLDSNLDENYWTPEKRVAAVATMEKAKLRALVRNAGRTVLLKQQNDLIREKYLNLPDLSQSHKHIHPQEVVQPQRKVPAPSMQILVDYKAQEREGAKLLMERPDKFFIFEDQSPVTDLNDDDDDHANHTNHTNKRSSLPQGRPVSLRHEFGAGRAELPFPVLMGRDLPPDTRTARERKRAQKEEERQARRSLAEETEEGGLDFEHDDRPPAADDGPYPEGEPWIQYVLNKQANTTTTTTTNNDQESPTQRTTMYTREDLEKVPLAERLFDEDVEWILERLQERAAQKQVYLERQSEDILQGSSKGSTLTDDDLDLIRQGAAIMDKLTDDQVSKVEALTFDAPDATTTTDHMVKRIEQTLGEGVLTNEDIQTMVRIEQKLDQDKALRRKLMDNE